MTQDEGVIDAIAGTNGYGTAPGATNGYSCVKCHSTGFSNQGTQAGGTGLCAPDSTKTTAAACTSPNTWFPDTGLRGVFPISGVSPAGAEPNASFPGIDLGKKASYNPTWDQDGVMCSRCHYVTFPESYDSFSNAASGNGHDWSPPISSGAQITNLCYGCHQNQGKYYSKTGTFGEPSNAAGVTILDPTMVAGALKGTTNVVPTDLAGHATGGGFLNSPHARYVGKITPSPIGNYDLDSYLTSTGRIFTGTFNSAFKGYICRSAANGGGSQLETLMTGTVLGEIKSESDCNLANNVASNQTTTHFWQPSEDGKPACTICHDQHNSLFVASESEKAMKRECEDCHSATSTYQTYVPQVPTIDVTAINHPNAPGTPFDASLDLGSPCEICHMAKQAVVNGNQTFAAHLFRINTDPNYSTMPTATALYGGSCSVVTNASIKSAAACATAGGSWTVAAQDPRANAYPEIYDPVACSPTRSG